jgi:hypothetical protein
MAIQENTQVPPSAHWLAERWEDAPAQFWTPPLAPTGTRGHEDDAGVPLVPYALGPVTRAEDTSEFPGKSDLPEPQASFRWSRKVIAGTAVAAAMGACAVAYFFLGSASEQTPTQTAEAAPAVQSSPAAPNETPAVSVFEPFAAPRATATWPELPGYSAPARTPDPAGPSLQVASPAPSGNTAARQTASASQKHDVLFLQATGVNIRSTPATNGTVLGTAPKGTRFEVTNRQGDWVQVESGRWKGWINARFLAPNEPR